jgi:AraC family transcriptional regulator
MQTRFVTIRTKKLIGKKLQMSVINDRTMELWQSFMPRRKEITNVENDFLYSVQVFESEKYFERFSPEIEFEKWAAVEIAEFTNIPESMEMLEIPEGLYAVFNYTGPANAALPFFQYIFQTWIPESEYSVDNRPHLALMGEKYRGNNPDSEEEIWVPVKKKISNIE